MRKALDGNGLTGVLIRGVSGSFGIKIAGAAIAFVTQIVLARTLGVAEFGKYAYAFTLVGILLLFAKHGMDTTVVRYVAGYRARAEWALMRGILQTAFKSVLLTSAILIVLGAIVVTLIRKSIDSGQAETILLALLLVPILALTAIRQSALQALKHVVRAQLPDSIFRPLVLIVIVMATSAWIVRDMNAQHAMVLNIIAATFAFLVGGRFLLSTLPQEVLAAAPDSRRKEWLGVSIPLFIISALNMVMSNTDILMIGPILGSDAAGMYAAAARVSGLVSFGLTAANTIVAPMIAEFYSAGNRDDLSRMLVLTARGIFVFTVTACAVLLLFSVPILQLFGDDFVAGRIPLLVLLAGHAVNALTGSVGFVMVMTGHHKAAVHILGVSTVVNIVLNATLIPAFGLVGAATATAITTMAWNLAMLWYVYRKLGINPTIFARLAK